VWTVRWRIQFHLLLDSSILLFMILFFVSFTFFISLFLFLFFIFIFILLFLFLFLFFLFCFYFYFQDEWVTGTPYPLTWLTANWTSRNNWSLTLDYQLLDDTIDGVVLSKFVLAFQTEVHSFYKYSFIYLSTRSFIY
jgi:hypothetical protein